MIVRSERPSSIDRPERAWAARRGVQTATGTCAALLIMSGGCCCCCLDEDGAADTEDPVAENP